MPPFPIYLIIAENTPPPPTFLPPAPFYPPCPFFLLRACLSHVSLCSLGRFPRLALILTTVSRPPPRGRAKPVQCSQNGVVANVGRGGEMGSEGGRAVSFGQSCMPHAPHWGGRMGSGSWQTAVAAGRHDPPSWQGGWQWR